MLHSKVYFIFIYTLATCKRVILLGVITHMQAVDPGLLRNTESFWDQNSRESEKIKFRVTAPCAHALRR